jgi:hypothetical protein
MIIANMATYPKRTEIIIKSIESLLNQVDRLNLCLNEFTEVPDFLKRIKKVNCIIPKKDHKDVGKFVSNFKPDDDVFFVDDDIIYPADYVKTCCDIRNKYKVISPIVGFHGVIYSDLFDGSAAGRNVFKFDKTLMQDRVVNQLGTGTIYCKGYQAPSLDFMLTSQKFVDVRFALNAFENDWPMICGKRQQGWMQEVEVEETIFTGFTKKWPLNVIREVQPITGYSALSLSAISLVEKI